MPTRVREQQECPLSPLLPKIALEVLVNAIKIRKRKRESDSLKENYIRQ